LNKFFCHGLQHGTTCSPLLLPLDCLPLQVPAELVAEAEQQAKAAAEESDMED
jgi:hypothetical protein